MSFEFGGKTTVSWMQSLSGELSVKNWLEGKLMVGEQPGDVILKTEINGDGVTIEHADPHILISAEILDLIRASRHSRVTTLDGDILKIVADDRTVIYRIGDPTEDGRAYHAEWPD